MKGILTKEMEEVEKLIDQAEKEIKELRKLLDQKTIREEFREQMAVYSQEEKLFRLRLRISQSAV